MANDSITVNKPAKKRLADYELVRRIGAGAVRNDGNTVSGDGCDANCNPDQAIPTVSQWGMIVMSLLLLTVGVIVILRRSPCMWGLTPPGP